MINKENILKLYNGEYNFSEFPPPKTKLYADSLDSCIELEKSILHKLDSDKELLEDYLNSINEMYSEKLKQTYTEGFSLGLKLSVEALWK